MSSGRPNFKRIQKTKSRNITSNQSASSSGHASESIGTSRPNNSRPDASRPNASRQNASLSIASRQNASLSNASRPASPTPKSDNGSSGDNGTMPRRNSRGPSRGISLDKYVKKFGKMKIVFNSRERKPIKYEEDFANGIGISIRTCGEIDGVSLWKEVPAETKQILYEHLEQWFVIEDWDNDQRVQDIVDQMLQESYRQWRYKLGRYCKNVKNEKRNPRNQCPRPEVPMENWLAVCDRVESQKFKERSFTNQANRECLAFPHTSGRRSCPSEIELWRTNHVDKNEKMIELKNTTVLEGETTMIEAEIIEVILGHRSGFKKGMGSGVEVPRVTKRLRTQEVESFNEKINNLTTELEQQKEENKNNKELICIINAENESNKEKIQSPTTQVERFNQFMCKFPEFGQS
ncbi:hypothetical protein OROHE_002586 [Orobanche hederae]